MLVTPLSLPYFARSKRRGALAQLVERLNGIEKVSGSNPLCSTKFGSGWKRTSY
jgi:hypothetical protein